MNRVKQTRSLLIFLGTLVPALLFAVLFTSLSITTPGRRAELGVSYFVNDRDPPLTLAEIQNLSNDAWRPLAPHRRLGGGLKPQEYWFQIKLPRDGRSEDVIGRLNHIYIYEAAFYLDDNPQLQPRLIGSSKTPETWAYQHEPSFVVRPSTGFEQRVLVRVHGRAFWAIALSVQYQTDAILTLKDMRVLTAGILGSSFGISLLCVVFFAILRVRTFAIIGLMQLAISLFLAIFAGYIYFAMPGLTAWPRGNIILGNSCLLLGTALFVQALMEYFSTDHFSRSLATAKKALASTLVFLLIMPAMPDALRDISFGLYYIYLAWVLGARLLREWRLEVTWLLSSAASTQIVGIGASLLLWTGVLPNSLYLEYSGFLTTMWFSAVMMGDVAFETRRINREREATVEQLRKASAQMVQDGPGGAPQSYAVTIMFIDMVGFSQTAAKLTSEKVFRLLSQRMMAMVRVVESYAGIIDRSLGDGLLCYFPVGQTAHAVRAFEAACTIHRMVLDVAIDGRYTEDALMPVRIGLHSDEVLIGNISGGSRIDFTMIGQGVNFANRLEQACAPFCVLLSETTRDELTKAGHSSNDFVPVRLPSKYQAEPLLAYEHAPWSNEVRTVVQAQFVKAQRLGAKLRERRYQLRLPHQAKLLMARGGGVFVIREFSLYGFRVAGGEMFARGTLLELCLSVGEAHIDHTLATKVLQTFTAEVRWGRSSEGGFEHGLMVVGDAPAAANFRLSLLQTHPEAVMLSDFAA